MCKENCLKVGQWTIKKNKQKQDTYILKCIRHKATIIIYVQIYLDHKICIQARDSRAEKVDLRWNDLQLRYKTNSDKLPV